MRKKGKFEQPRQYDPTVYEDPAVYEDPVPQLPEDEDDDLDEPVQKRRSGFTAAVVTASVAAVLVLGILGGGLLLQKSDTIYPNIYVAGIDVGGMDRVEAISAVGAAVEASYSSSTLEVELPDRILSFNPQQTNVALDAEEVIDEAIACGRSGNPLETLLNYFRFRDMEHSIDLQTILNLDTAYIRQLIDQTAAEVAQEAKPSAVDYDEATGRLTVDVGQPQRYLDAEGLYEAVYSAFMNSEFDPFPWSYEESEVEPVDLTPYYAELCTQVQDAVYEEETHTILEEVPGYGFNLDAETQRLAQAKPGSQVVIQLEDMAPAVTKEQLTSEMFGEKLYSVSTKYVNNANRTNNLKLACEAINGTILNVGEVFSFNDVVGERTSAKGYLPATVFSGGGASNAENGGGVCQVASSIYYATLFLDLEQVERECHMYTVDYVPYGMDSTVYWGSIDYKFKNTLDQPFKIQANIDNGTVNITFWGAKPLDFRVEMRAECIGTFPWKEVEVLDESKPAGYRELVEPNPYTGYKYVSYKTVYDLEGNKLSDEKEAESYYKPRDKKYIVGPAAPVEPVEPEDPWYDPDDPWYDPGDNGTGDPLDPLG